MKPHLLEKVSFEKAENIFVHTSIKISENGDNKHLRRSKIDLSKETNKDSKKRYSANLRGSRLEVPYRKGKKLKSSQQNNTGNGTDLFL